MKSSPESFISVVIAYILKYLDAFKENLEKATHEYDPEAIHEYRVAVKRLRAIVRTLDKIYHEPLFPADMILPLRLMFKAGGTIRDDQVQIGLVEEIENLSGLNFPLIKEHYTKRIEAQRKAFFLVSLEFDYSTVDEIARKAEDILNTLDDAFLELNLYRRLHKSMENLKLKRYDLDEPGELHRFRTRFKSNGYIAEMVYHSQYSHKVSKKVYNRMKNFGQELGKWHDYHQLWSNAGLVFQESRNIALLSESFELRKFITPHYEKLFQEILHLIKRDDSLFMV